MVAAVLRTSDSDSSQLKNSAETIDELASQHGCDGDDDGGGFEGDGDADGERAALDAYARSCDAIVAKSVERYVGFVRRRRRVVDPARWALICEARGLRVYKERVELRSMASVASLLSEDDGDGGAGRASEEVAELPVAASDDERARRSGNASSASSSASSSSSSRLRRQASVVRSPSTMVSAFCVGRLRGSLDSVMAGLYADTADDMRANCTIQFGDELLDCGIVQTFERADADGGDAQQQPQQYRYFGVKWLEKQSAFPPGVVDQLCWVERTGVHTIASGRRFGYQLLKSVVPLEEQASSACGAARPASISLCYLYCQLDADLVEVFVRGIVEVGSSPAVSGPADEAQELAVRAAGDFILAAVRGRECGRMRKIAQLIDQSKSDRAQLTACNCSKVIAGLPKVEMCATCVEAMRERKLVDVRELTRASRSLAATERSAAQLALLQTRYGSVRRDAEVPEALLLESYREAQSFRMFLPIRDPRPRSGYRAARKQSGNVLMQMLERNHRQGSFLPTFLRPDEDDDEVAAAAAAAAATAANTAANARGGAALASASTRKRAGRQQVRVGAP